MLHSILRVSTITILTIPASLALAQDDMNGDDTTADDMANGDVVVDDTTMSPERSEIKTGTDWRYSLNLSGIYQFETDLEHDGDVSVGRLGARMTGFKPLSPDARVRFDLAYSGDIYDFGGDNDFGDDPWDTAHTFQAGVAWEWDLDPSWSAFAGPLLRFSGESGADFGDAITYGGVVGAVYDVDANLQLGLGLSIATELEDGTRFVPFPIVDWQINEQWSLETVGYGASVRPTGLELSYDAGGWEYAIGGGYHYREFRLDDDDVAPDGIGEENGFPVWFRASHQLDDNFRVDLYAGIMFNGEFDLDDDGGDAIVDVDYDDAFFLGVSAGWTW